MEQNYTGTLGENNKQHKHKAKYNYIAVLDLGSESMSAFFGKTDRTMFFQIDLQDEDNIKRWTGWDANINFLLDNNGNKSLRLRNKIVVSTQRGYHIKNKNNHAKLDYNKDYEKSIFEIYQLKTDFNFTYLCNPKVIYTKGIKKILPNIQDSSGTSVNIEPAEYLKHLTAQIVNNLILNDKRIKDIPATNIKLVITIPNVYSLTHAKELVDFLSTHTDYAEIDYVYESDAVVYASIVNNYHYFKNKKYLEKKFKKINFLLNQKQPVNIISHDIGKGTSDLSFFQIYPETDSDRYSINIKARTGLTKAGNALDYVFVNFMEDYILKPFYKSENIDLNSAISLIEKRGLIPVQNEINSNIQEIIYLIKKNIKKKKSISRNFYKQVKTFSNDNINTIIKTDADKFRNSLNKACEKIIDGTKSLEGIKKEIKEKDDNNKFNEEGKRLINELYNSFINKLFSGNRLMGYKLKSKLLTKNIDNYIEALGNNLPTILKHNAKELSSVEQNQTFVLNNDNTFVIISGQASQFKPLRKKLIKRYGSLFSISEDKIILLENTISKDICAIGGFVQEQVKNQFNLVNPDDLLADYYLINTAGVDRNPRLDYIKLNQGEMIKVEKAGNPDLFLYSIINYNDDDITEIVKIDSDENETKNLDIEDFKSFIRGFTNNGIYTIKYDKQKTCFVINGNVVELGNKPQTNDHIYTNTWPEILK